MSHSTSYFSVQQYKDHNASGDTVLQTVLNDGGFAFSDRTTEVSTEKPEGQAIRAEVANNKATSENIPKDAAADEAEEASKKEYKIDAAGDYMSDGTDESKENSKDGGTPESSQEPKKESKDEVKRDDADDEPEDKPAPSPSPAPKPPAQKSCDSDGDSSDSPIEDWEELYSDDDMVRKPRLTPAGPPKRHDERYESEEEDLPDPWNAISIVGVRVYSMDEDLEVHVFMEGDELLEDGMG
ncbi:hypothetical protein BDP55DRAFT_720967 [Colletotrichum godetiae]|uniref:Uncharacterized protein n=1 Tax=Colletotrichum godetiae TaxID=1209918 RepID=A0AAJ0AAM4_9PEZI|nr:uncharacterized protein BDP55DRAFT_720967 [Colletotrichum godetiae]KAK1658087.1 hypothetical protein BDP55DRAFT_720967 [Colletotrichum godetiae]